MIINSRDNFGCAIARLDEAKLNYQKQQYEHSLKVSDYQTKLQQQQNQIASLQSQLDKVDEELEQLTSVYSPYRGKVRRVKILGQNERSINERSDIEYSGWELEGDRMTLMFRHDCKEKRKFIKISN